MRDYPPLGLVNLPWYVIMSAPLIAEEMDREAWIDGLARKWGLVRSDATGGEAGRLPRSAACSHR